jgi:hypothetical protein
MRGRLTLCITLACMALPPLAHSPAQTHEISQQNYSTCPDFEHAVVRNVAYMQVNDSALLKWAAVKIYPDSTSTKEKVRVELQIEGENVFCAQALNGSEEKQKAAVDAAMHWKFKKKRGDFKQDIMGVLTFNF